MKGAEELTDTGKFLRALFPVIDASSLIEIRVKWPNRCPHCRKRFCSEFFDDRDAAEEAVISVGHLSDCYIGVSTRRSRKNGRKTNLGWAGAYFCELDAGPRKPYKGTDEILATLDAFEPMPSLRVLSGGGVHCYWIVDIPLPLFTPEQIAEFEEVTRGLQQSLLGDPGTWNADRILRPPGSFWHKQQPPRRVELVA